MSSILTHWDFTLLAVEKPGCLWQGYGDYRCVSTKDELGEGCGKTGGQMAGDLVRGCSGTPRQRT